MRRGGRWLAAVILIPLLAGPAGAGQLRRAAGGAPHESEPRRSLDDLDQRLDELERRLQTMREESRERFARALAELRRKRRLLERRLNELGTTADAEWRRMRRRLESALEELRKGLEPPSPPDVTKT